MAIKPPEPDWVPLLDALFLVGSSDPGAPRGTLEGLARRVRYAIRKEPYKVEARTEFVVVGLGKVELCVHLPSGFALTKTLDGREPSREDDYIAFGPDLLSFMHHVLEAAHRGLGETDIEIVERLSVKIWAELDRILDQALELGQWAIVARTDNPLAESFDFIPWDIWRHFRVSDWETGNAKAINGARLYSIHLAAKSASKPGRAKREKGRTKETRKASPRRQRSGPATERTRLALSEIYPNGIPPKGAISDQQLMNKVDRWCKDKGYLPVPSYKTVVATTRELRELAEKRRKRRKALNTPNEF